MTDHLKFPVSWPDLHRDAKALAWRLKGLKDEWKGIVAVTRGGLIPSGIVAQELGIKNIETFCIRTYEDTEQQSEAEIIKKPELENDGEGWLIIDDLVDTGNTFEIIRKHFSKAHYACVYAKPQGEPSTDTYITEVSQDTWIVFPWDQSP